MGGLGSGSWCRSNTKPTGESCRALDVVRLMYGRNPLFVHGSGTITWTDRSTGKIRASIGYSVLPSDNGLLLKLVYNANNQLVEIPISLTMTYPSFGGERWWFTCPLVVNKVPCSRRV